MNKRPNINKTLSIETNKPDVNQKRGRLRTAGLGLFLTVGILLTTGTSAVASEYARIPERPRFRVLIVDNP